VTFIKADIMPEIQIQKVSLIQNSMSQSLDTLDLGLNWAEFNVKCVQVGCCYGCD